MRPHLSPFPGDSSDSSLEFHPAGIMGCNEGADHLWFMLQSIVRLPCLSLVRQEAESARRLVASYDISSEQAASFSFKCALGRLWCIWPLGVSSQRWSLHLSYTPFHIGDPCVFDRGVLQDRLVHQLTQIIDLCAENSAN